MRYGIIADIHGNVEALDNAIAFLQKEEVDEILCLGDVIGYNADPVECLAKVRSTCAAVIQGNHERMVLGGSLEGVRRETLEATEWTRNQLSEDDIEWIKTWPDEATAAMHPTEAEKHMPGNTGFFLRTRAERPETGAPRHGNGCTGATRTGRTEN